MRLLSLSITVLGVLVTLNLPSPAGGQTPAVLPVEDQTKPTPLSPGGAALVQSAELEPQIQVSEVTVLGVEGRLYEVAYAAIQSRPGRTITRSQLQEDINTVLATGYFSNVRTELVNTPIGVQVNFIVQPSSALGLVKTAGEQLPQENASSQEQNLEGNDQKLNGDFRITLKDERGNPLNLNSIGQENPLTFQASAAKDLRDNSLTPTQGSYLQLSTEQSISSDSSNSLINRIQGNYSYYVPVELTSFTKGPQALAFNVQAGTLLGDLSPDQAFKLGGIDSVRGYGEGELGSGYSFVQASAEYRFPVLNIFSGTLFFDAATNLGTGEENLGSGFGYGAGVRIKSPLGTIRIDYGLNDQGDNKLQFGIGERF